VAFKQPRVYSIANRFGIQVDLSATPAHHSDAASGECEARIGLDMQDDVPRPAWARARAIAAALAAVGAAMPAMGATQQPEIAAWRVECTGDGKSLDCRAVQQLYRRDTRQLLISVLVRKAKDPKGAEITMQLPLGINLTEPVLVRVDNGPSERHAIQTCTNIGCFVRMKANDKFVAAMRTGHQLKVTMQDARKKSIEMSLPLLGFGIAFDKARS
jgi:invasion protein IalB